MVLDLYYVPRSPACYTVQMVAKAVNVELNLKELDLTKGEHLTPEFLKVNPQHTVPTLVDDGFAVWESRAIIIYLVQKYGKNDALYPSDPKKRAIVNQRLYFDAGTLYTRMIGYFSPLFRKQPTKPEDLQKLEDAIVFLNTFLEGQTYAAGNELTLADIALIVNVSVLEAFGIDFKKHENISRWLQNTKKVVAGYEIIENGIAKLKEFMNALK